jgi:hypothetical protein
LWEATLELRQHSFALPQICWHGCCLTDKSGSSIRTI